MTSSIEKRSDSEDINLEQDRRIFLGREHLRQRDILASALALQGFLQTKDEYVASLPKKFDLDSEDSPLFPAIIDPRIRLETLLALMGITVNINAQATKDLEKEVVTPKTPYVVRTIVIEDESFDAALLLRNNPSFRGAKAIEGAPWSLYNSDLLDEDPIYLPSSRTEQIWMPNVRKTRKGKIEMSNDLPINRGSGKIKFLLVAR